jgi:hypothetical protein
MADGLWWRAANGQMIHMLKRPLPNPATVAVHFALDVTDLEAAIKPLENAGYKVDRGPYVQGVGRIAFVRDPAGNVIELNENDGMYDTVIAEKLANSEECRST